MNNVLVIVIVAVVLIILIWLIAVSNRIDKAKIKIEEAQSGIDVALTKRYDVLKKMIEVVKGYAKHEQETIFKTMEMRKGISVSELNETKREMSEQFGKINMLAESYPELKSNENFNTLQLSISVVEEHLQATRRLYNSNVSSYNQMIKVFPNSIIAGSKGCKTKEFFVAEEEKKQDVKMDF